MLKGQLNGFLGVSLPTAFKINDINDLFKTQISVLNPVKMLYGLFKCDLQERKKVGWIKHIWGLPCFYFLLIFWPFSGIQSYSLYSLAVHLQGNLNLPIFICEESHHLCAIKNLNTNQISYNFNLQLKTCLFTISYRRWKDVSRFEKLQCKKQK